MTMEIDEEKRTVRGEVVTDEARADDIAPTYFVAQDMDLLKDVLGDVDLSQMKALYSPLTRLTKISEKEKRLWQIDVDLMMASMLIKMKRREYNQGRWAKMESNALFLKTVINDSHKGFKMTLLSRLRKEIVVSPERKPGLLDRFRRS